MFNGSQSNLKSLQDLALLRLGWWLKGWDSTFLFSSIEIQRNPLCLLWSGFADATALRPPNPSPEIWSPPPNQCLKWNVDASVKQSSQGSAIGGVLRNSKGSFVCLFSSPIPFIEINCAEILAIHRAIAISIMDETTRSSPIVIESDSVNAVNWCNNSNGGPWNMAFHLNFIHHAKNHVLNLIILHKKRSSNAVADSLAKQGLHRRSDFLAWL